MMITLGAISIAFGLIRIFAYRIPESPQYLLSKGRDAEAVEAVNYIARYNRKPETLTLEMLQEIDTHLGNATAEDGKKGLSHMMILKNNLQDYKSVNVKKLFATRRFALHTSLTWTIWLVIGESSFLFLVYNPEYQTTFSQIDTHLPRNRLSSLLQLYHGLHFSSRLRDWQLHGILWSILRRVRSRRHRTSCRSCVDRD